MFNFFSKRQKKEYVLDKTRLKILIAFFTFLFFVVLIKLFHVSLLQKSSINNHKHKSTKRQIHEYNRIPILDRNGKIIATDIGTVSLYFNKDLIKRPTDVSIQITKKLEDINIDSLYRKLTNKKSKAKYVLVKRNLTPKEQLKVRKLGIAGTVFAKDKKRIYPHRNLFSHIVGYSDIDRNGLSGLEKQYDEFLKNSENGFLKTTLDLRVQAITRNELVKGMLKFKAKAMVGIVTNTKTGEILSAVSLPDFNPNYLKNINPNKKFNRITYGIYEMGSIFKVFNTALALDKKIVDLKKTYEVAKPISYGKFKISDTHFKKPIMNVEDILVYSSNIGTAKMALDIGIENQVDFLGSLGLLTKVETDFPSLAMPLTPTRWREINLMTISYGHGIAVTPLHIARAISGIVNNGVMHNLKFTNQVKDETRQIISNKISLQMRKLMRKVVTNGTGWRSNTLGYLVGGKTGTAEKISKEGGYNEERLRTAFVASFPMDDPQYTVFVMADDPDASELGRMTTGGSVSAPIVSRIIENIAPILGIEPDIE